MKHEMYLYHVNPLGHCPAGYEESLKAFKQGSCKILILFFKDDLWGNVNIVHTLELETGGSIFRVFYNSKETRC